jgi:hypothetical protein
MKKKHDIFKNEKDYHRAIAFVEVNQFEDHKSSVGKKVKELLKRIEKYENASD